MSKIKLLVSGDGGLRTGFARVLHSIIENLPEDDYEVHHLAVNYSGDPFPTVPWHMLYPAKIGGDNLGLNRIRKLADQIKPDAIFILNDLWLTQMFLQKLTTDELRKTISYFPVDALDSDPDWLERFEFLASVNAYTQFGKDEVLKLKPELKVNIIPHGVDTSIFFKEDRETALAAIAPKFSPEDFTVLNVNRNQPRKRLDLTLQTFAKFAADKPKNVRIYMHAGIVDAGWNLITLARRYGISDRLVVSSLSLSPANFVTDETLNHIYNIADVGINTSTGEGWGLPNVEHAATGAVQLVPDNSASKELFEDCGLLMGVDTESVNIGPMTTGSLINVESAADQLNRLYYDKDLSEELSSKCYDKFNQPKYSWANISKTWDKIFKEVAGGGNNLA